MKKFFLGLLFLMLGSVLFAQHGYRDVVYLKNGSVVKGIIVEQVPNNSITIQTIDGCKWHFNNKVIRKIAKEKILNYRYQIQSTGWRTNLDLGYSFGSGTYGFDKATYNASFGYQSSIGLLLGVGLGMHYYVTPKLGTMPIFVNMRYSLPFASVSPFIDMKAGYSLVFSEGIDGGFYFSPTVGCKFALNNKSYMYVGCSYDLQNLAGLVRPSDNYSDEITGVQGVGLKLGFEF